MGTLDAPDGSRVVLQEAAGGALVACVALVVLIGRRVVTSIDGPVDHAVVATAAVAGVLACDLAAGVVHWACDRFFTETTPILGAVFIAPFREHHCDPLAMTRRGFLDVNSSNYFAMLPLLAYAAWGDVAGDAAALFGHTFLLTFATAAALTNQFHKWAHAPGVPLPVRWLQRAHLILPPHVHARHHSDAHTSAYCVTGGWLNPLLDRLDLFGRLERAIRACVPGTGRVDREAQSS
jgi:ubiquitin-conjugating enzyme E2 variant